MKKLSSAVAMAVCISAVSFFGSAQNTWSVKNDLPVGSIVSPVGFNIGDKGYVVTGTDINGNGSVKLWEYNPGTDAWVSKANFPGPTRTDAVVFVVGTKAYICTGTGVSSGNLLNDVWQYDQSTDSWSQKSNFPGSPRKMAASFVINDKGYITTGWDNAMTLKKDLWQYNPTTDSWVSKANLPISGGRYYGIGFTIGNRGYYCSGADEGGATIPNDLWEYNDANDTWVSRTSIPASCGLTNSGRFRSFSFSIGTSGFIGAGAYIDQNIGFQPMYCHDFWEYNQLTDSWTQRQDFPGGNRQWLFGFSVGNKGYAGGGEQVSNGFSDLYEYSSDIAISGVEENALEDKLVVYPMPATDELTLLSKESLSLEVYDVLGSKIAVIDANAHEKTHLNTTFYKPGVYFIKQLNEDTGMVRFVVIR